MAKRVSVKNASAARAVKSALRRLGVKFKFVPMKKRSSRSRRRKNASKHRRRSSRRRRRRLNAGEVIRYFVSPHRGRYGQVTVKGWDVRKVVMGDSGIEKDGGVTNTFPNKREAKEHAEELNRYLPRTAR